jgi:hypothetical protein
VPFGEFTDNGGRAVTTKSGGELVEGFEKSVRRLIEDDGACFQAEEIDTGVPPFFMREESLKDEGADRQPRNHKGGHKSSRSGKALYTEVAVDTFAYEEVSGIGDTGCAGVGDQSGGVSRLESLGKQEKIPLLVKLMVSKHTGLNAMVFEQDRGGTRIFGEDEIHRGEGTKCSESDVVHIPDGSGDESEGCLWRCRRKFHVY